MSDMRIVWCATGKSKVAEKSREKEKGARFPAFKKALHTVEQVDLAACNSLIHPEEKAVTLNYL